MEGRPWLFQKQLILFECILGLMDRKHIHQVHSPFWMKINMCTLECDKQDLLHAIGTSFRGALNSEIKDDHCCLKVNVDIQNLLRRGIFVDTNVSNQTWVPFKYENLQGFYFKCGRMGHVHMDCVFSFTSNNQSVDGDFPYSAVL